MTFKFGCVGAGQSKHLAEHLVALTRLTACSLNYDDFYYNDHNYYDSYYDSYYPDSYQ